jgi:hypothetical protein
MRTRYRVVSLVLVVGCLCITFAYVYWKARIKHILRTTPTADVLKQMLCHESMFLLSWDDIKGSVEVTIFEGLPHQRYESESLKAEEQHKSTIRISEFPFYSEERPFEHQSARRMMELLTWSANFQTVKGAKACGGFHPDYALCLTVRESRYYVLFCFGCGDIRIILPEGEKEFALTRNSAQHMKAILEKYRKNRPPMRSEF